MMHTMRYRQGYIHVSYVEGREKVHVSVSPYAYCMEVKSVRAAKIRITKFAKENCL